MSWTEVPGIHDAFLLIPKNKQSKKPQQTMGSIILLPDAGQSFKSLHALSSSFGLHFQVVCLTGQSNIDDYCTLLEKTYQQVMDRKEHLYLVGKGIGALAALVSAQHNPHYKGMVAMSPYPSGAECKRDVQKWIRPIVEKSHLKVPVMLLVEQGPNEFSLVQSLASYLMDQDTAHEMVSHIAYSAVPKAFSESTASTDKCAALMIHFFGNIGKPVVMSALEKKSKSKSDSNSHGSSLSHSHSRSHSRSGSDSSQ
jgi:pimeloyl-ACP methyl ester carboxylesterase